MDIDIDCIESDRPAIFKHIVERFGKRKTARVASFGTAQSRGVIDDVGRYLAAKWDEEGHAGENPWSLANIKRIKNEFDSNPEKAKKDYPELFYYYDGLLDTKISQSVHPAGMVISPITLDDNYGTFDKDGDICLMLDMDNIHDFTGLAKYDFLVLKTVQVIRDTCNYLDVKYPLTHEINWEDNEVWDSMVESNFGLFQMESRFSFECLKKFKPRSITDMAIVSACIRPSGASYRDELLARIPHKNPSKMIDDLLSDSLSFLVYQEQTIKFLQQICGLSGSESDNIRRAIGRKQKDRLDAAMPKILEGYCSKSDKPREVAEAEAKEFLKVIEDSASYQFGYNHSIAYCLLGYLCAYYRHYHPLEFITSFLNNAANDDDIKNGTTYANSIGIKITMPKWGVSKGEYFFDKERNIIAKGLSSVKYMGDKVADELYELYQTDGKDVTYFMDLLKLINERTSLNSKQLDILIKLDFFSEFGNQRILLRLAEMFFGIFKRGEVCQISKIKVQGTSFEKIVQKYSVGVTKAGTPAKSYTVLDVRAIMIEEEEELKNLDIPDIDITVKARNFYEAMGYYGYMSGEQNDRPKLQIVKLFPIYKRKDHSQCGYRATTTSLGSGIESVFTIFNSVYNRCPIKEGDIVVCKAYTKEKGYFTMTRYEKLS